MYKRQHLVLAAPLALAAWLVPGAAQAARDACPQAAAIVHMAYPEAPAPDGEEMCIRDRY